MKMTIKNLEANKFRDETLTCVVSKTDSNVKSKQTKNRHKINFKNNNSRTKKKRKKSVKISRNILEVLTSSTHPQKAYRVA